MRKTSPKDKNYRADKIIKYSFILVSAISITICTYSIINLSNLEEILRLSTESLQQSLQEQNYKIKTIDGLPNIIGRKGTYTHNITRLLEFIDYYNVSKIDVTGGHFYAVSEEYFYCYVSDEWIIEIHGLPFNEYDWVNPISGETIRTGWFIIRLPF